MVSVVRKKQDILVGQESLVGHSKKLPLYIGMEESVDSGHSGKGSGSASTWKKSLGPKVPGQVVLVNWASADCPFSWTDVLSPSLHQAMEHHMVTAQLPLPMVCTPSY